MMLGLSVGLPISGGIRYKELDETYLGPLVLLYYYEDGNYMRLEKIG